MGLLERWDAKNQQAADTARRDGRLPLRMYAPRPWQFGVWVVLVGVVVATRNLWVLVLAVSFLIYAVLDGMRRW